MGGAGGQRKPLPGGPGVPAPLAVEHCAPSPAGLLRAPFRRARLPHQSLRGSLLTQAKRSLPFPLSAVFCWQSKKDRSAHSPPLPARGARAGKRDVPAWAAVPQGCARGVWTARGPPLPSAHPWAQPRALPVLPERTPSRSALGAREPGSVLLPPQRPLAPTLLPQTAHRVGHSHPVSEPSLSLWMSWCSLCPWARPVYDTVTHGDVAGPENGGLKPRHKVRP